MAQVSVQDETEEAGGWSFCVLVGADDRACCVRLSWVDYEYWSRGQHAPARVVEALVRYLIDREGESAVRSRFDAATIRRALPSVDQDLPGMF